MVGCCDSATHTLVLSDGPVLVEGGDAFDRGGIFAHGFVNRVDGSIASQVGDEVHIPVWVDSAVILEDVVLGERAGEPAINRQETHAIGFVGAAVGYVSGLLISSKGLPEVIPGP